MVGGPTKPSVVTKFREIPGATHRVSCTDLLSHCIMWACDFAKNVTLNQKDLKKQL